MRAIVGADPPQRGKEQMTEQGGEKKSVAVKGGGRRKRREEARAGVFGIKESENSLAWQGWRSEDAGARAGVGETRKALISLGREHKDCGGVLAELPQNISIAW